MLQPFERFLAFYVEKLIHLKKIYLVTQTYSRGDKAEVKHDILVSDYDDLGLARVHLNAVKQDHYAAIIDLRKPEHKRTLFDMLQAQSRYHLYWAVVRSPKELEERVNLKYSDHIRRYVDAHTSWRIGRDTVIRPALQVIFGELYMILKYAGQTLRVKFEDIEKS